MTTLTADGAPEDGAAAASLSCDRAIFTSLPSATGEGYRLVAWSNGVRPEERQELTRRAPSHGALAGEGESPRALVLLRLQSSGRACHGLVRVSGAEHTQRGGGRVWTEFLVADAFEAARLGLSAAPLREALAAAGPPPKPVGRSALAPVEVRATGSGAPAGKGPRAAQVAAAVASLLFAGTPAVVAAGAAPLEAFEDALRMLPAAARSGLEAAGGLRYSSARGVTLTVTDKIEQDTIRAIRGHGIEAIDFARGVPEPSGALAAWFALMVRWWNAGRGEAAVALADRLGDGWTTTRVLEVVALCEAIDRGDRQPEALEDLLGA